VRRIELETSSPAVTLNVFADVPENLAADAEAIARFNAMVQQSYKVFGRPTYRRYELLLALHDHIASHALEHLGSTEIRRPPAFFTRWKTMASERIVIPHEFAHVWIGKKHRPEDLATPNYNVPMRNTLLWSYEGEAEYWAVVLAARSGMVTSQQAQELLARVAGYLGARKGREWRALQDTTNEPTIRFDRSRDWASWQRGVDYYGEGIFLWLEADARIRLLSGDTRSLDDFARRFHGGASSRPGTVTYGFNDIVEALNEVAPANWRAFLRERLDSTSRDNGMEALKAVGWRIRFDEKPSEYQEAADRENGLTDFAYSLGMVVGRQDLISAVVWDGPAFRAGLSGGATLLAVNGRAYKADGLKSAIRGAKTSGAPISLLVKRADVYTTVSIDYRDGLRYPHLEPILGVPDRLTAILAAR
jgi:predicted metalloprotease with PDZ domain